MTARWIATMAALSTIACTPAAAPPPSPPAQAQPLTEAGAHDQRLDDVVQELRDALGTQLAVKAYKLPAGTAWPAVDAHYRGALSGWVDEPALPERIRAAHADAWKQGGDLLAIALIDTPVAGEQSDFAILVVAEKR